MKIDEKIRIDYYYRNEKNKPYPNAVGFKLGRIELYFSFNTLIAFRVPYTSMFISENIWGQTTGRHLNAIDPDKSKRLPRKEFEAKADQLLSELHINF